MDDTVAASGSVEAWYRAEHPRLIGLLTVAAGDADVAREVTAEAFSRALERWPGPCPRPIGRWPC